MECAVVFLVLMAIPGALGHCYHGIYNATVEFEFLNDKNGSHTWSVGVPSINISITISCPSYFDDRYYFYLLRPNETTNDGGILGRVGVYNWGGLSCRAYDLHFSLTCQFDGGSSVNISASVFNATVERNSTSLTIMSRWTSEAFYRSPPIILRYCSTGDLPGDVEAISDSTRSFSYGDRVHVHCLWSELMLLNGGRYVGVLNIKCGQYAQWDIPQYKCDQGCPSPSNGVVQVTSVTSGTSYRQKYKTGSVVRISCVRGRMYSETKPSHFLTWNDTVCQSSGMWNHVVGCWTGQIVDFTSSSVTMHAGQPTVFSCVAGVSTNTIDMMIGNDVGVTQNSAWRNITVTSDHHGIIAACKEIDQFDIVVKTYETTLNVLYAPELLGAIASPQYELVMQTSGQAVIEFRANPQVTLNSILVSKNGSRIPNYYLLVDGVNHRVVVDFLEADENDFGDYVMHVTSPYYNPLTVNFTITKAVPTTEPKADMSAATGAGIAIAVIAAMAGIAVIVFFVVRSVRGKPKEQTNEVNEIAVSYDATDIDPSECHNYEDIDDKNVAGASQRVQPRGYANVQFGNSQNAYIVGGSHASNAATAARMPRQALKPKTWRVQDSAYEM